jgi:protein-disulfide isomerase
VLKKRPSRLWTAAWLLFSVGLGQSPGLEPVAGQTLEALVRDDGRMRGSATAPVTLIEYSDFTCGYCKKFFQETWPRLQAKYVQTGKVRFLYRDYPRSDQGPGLDAATAARCAGEQGLYWAMHDRLFGGDRRLGTADLQQHAQAIGLDLPRFSQCARDGRHVNAVFRDRAEGVSLSFRGTPGFVLLRTEPSAKEPPIVIPGAFPFEVFEEQIERLLGAGASRQKG